MNRENRNTLIMIIVVLIISIVALIAVISIAWGIVGDFVIASISSIGRFFNLQNLDYNFPIPVV